MRHSVRPRYADVSDGANGFALARLGPDEFAGACETARAWGVTVNDLFLALLLDALRPRAAARLAKASAKRRAIRDRVSVSCVANLRRDLGIDPGRTFGVFLGIFDVSAPLSPETDLAALAAEVHRQTGRVKRGGRGMRILYAFAWALAAGRVVSLSGMEKLFRRNHPVWGGATNVNLDAIPDLPPETPGLAYFRAVSTGPACPLVFSFTTCGGGLALGVSWRKTVFTREDVDAIISEVRGDLAGMPGGHA
jgi:hypothetical protein